MELFPDLPREAARQQALLQCVGGLEIALPGALADAQPPVAVGDNVGVEHVRADVEGIVGLAVLAEFGDLRLGDLSRQQHAAGLAADGPAADHPVPQRKIVLRFEVAAHQLPEVSVLGHGAVDNLRLHVRRECPGPERRLRHVEEAVVAVDVLVLALFPDLLDRLVVAADAHAIVNELKLPGASPVPVGHEHGLRIAFPHLQWMQVDPLLVGVYVQQELRRLPDAGDSVEGVPPPQDREIGHRVQLEQIGTGHPEEVAHHQIRVPDRLQFREAVEHVKGVAALARDLVVDGHGERLKAFVRIEFHQVHPVQVFEQGRVLGKADIGNTAPVLLCLRDEGQREEPEFIDVCDLPDDVVAHADVVEYVVHARISALYLVKGRHVIRLPGSSFMYANKNARVCAETCPVSTPLRLLYCEYYIMTF